ncbi:cytochrome b5 [Pyrenochaeta sp. DS3sAY3a]|nr:cytochrome b5 [Pyrenochaeta sp. DS3sAY3a]
MENDKIYPANEIRKHTDKGDLWLVIHNSVYNVSEFMEDHPGGADALLDQGGVDATSAFEDVGHSDDARKMMEDLRIGKADELVRLLLWNSR